MTRLRLVFQMSLVFICGIPVVSSRTIRFSGRDWDVRPSSRGEGPDNNKWDENNVWVDGNGHVHVKISKVNGEWFCAQLATTEKLPFGRYQFQVEGQIDNLDRNIVLGLFNYPTADVGPDATNEIDIEFSRWGIQNAPRAGYTIFPSALGLDRSTYQFDFTLTGTYTTHSFDWYSDHILFSSQHGHRNNSRADEFVSWDFRPAANYRSYIPQSPMKAFINLWLVKAQAPSNGKEVEIVIHSFQFVKKP